MSILFPLLVIPTFQASNGDAIIFYSTIAGVLSGSVAGDHMSPISDTTVSLLEPTFVFLVFVWTLVSLTHPLFSLPVYTS